LLDVVEARTWQAAVGILAYLACHPRAADSEQGITQWWLPRVGVDVGLADVQLALEALVQRGTVQRFALPDGRAIYRAPSPRSHSPAPATQKATTADMANIQAIHSVGNSIVTYLRNTYPAEEAGLAMPDCEFALMSSGELADRPDDRTRLTLYLYRVTVNEHLRQQRPDRMSPEQQAPLGLDLHFLLTAWANNAQDELLPLTWAMRQLYQHPILDASALSPEAAWGPDEVVQIIPSELSTEDMMRIWDALEPAYRLSVSYIARRVRLDPDMIADTGPVVATRFGYGSAMPAGSGV